MHLTATLTMAPASPSVLHPVQGIVTIPGRDITVPKAPKIIQPMPSFEEQGLCIGATFSLAATNGKDFDRRINILGFCQSIDMLNEALEETVTSRGGEVLEQERKLKSGVHEQVRKAGSCSLAPSVSCSALCENMCHLCWLYSDTYTCSCCPKKVGASAPPCSADTCVCGRQIVVPQHSHTDSLLPFHACGSALAAAAEDDSVHSVPLGGTPRGRCLV